ncbi:MAG: F0F1 ATP synthase subunit B' [Pseudomonadota bacterium]|nr:F0F1 ATP synthase subunit B' [Pseudomonadota bacterium]
MPQLDPSTWPPQLIWLAITFLTLYFVMARVALPRIGATIDNRRTIIARDLDGAQSLKIETENTLAEYESALTSARTRGQTLAQEGRQKLDAALEQERAKLNSDLGAQAIKAEKRVGDMKAAALENVEQVAAELAAKIVSQLGGSRITQKDAAEVVAKVRRR